MIVISHVFKAVKVLRVFHDSIYLVEIMKRSFHYKIHAIYKCECEESSIASKIYSVMKSCADFQTLIFLH